MAERDLSDTTALTKARSDDELRVANRVLREWFLTAMVTLLVVVWLVSSQITERADHMVYDGLNRIMPVEASEDIVVVGIDNRSLDAIGPWPWPRDIHARLIDRLSAVGSGPIAYDVLFLEQTPQDTALEAAVAKAGNVYMPALIGVPGSNGAPWFVDLPSGKLSSVAAGIGHVMLTPDEDGTVRHLPLWLSTEQQNHGHLVLPLAQTRLGTQTLSPPALARTAELTAAAPTLIRYPTQQAGYRVLSFIDVLNGEIPAEFLRNRLVLVGATAQGMGDRYATTNSPDSELVPGVEIQAALLQTLIDQSAPKQPSPIVHLLLSVLPIVLILVGFLFLRPASNTLLGLGLLVASIAASAIALKLGWWWPPVSAIAGVMIAWPLWSWRRLAAAYSYMQTEMSSLDRERSRLNLASLSSRPVWRTGDEISRQMHALHSTMKQVRDFNNFISQSVRSLPDAAVITDNDDVVLMANSRAQNLFADAELEHQPISKLFAQLGQSEWKKWLAVTTVAHEDIVTRDGRALQIATAPLTDAEGKRAGSIIRFADVTQMRAAERQRERTLQLLGHDMRAPQVSIIALLDNPKPPEDFLKRIRSNANQTLELAEGYVQLSRAESQMLRLQTTDLGQLLTEAADMMWPQAAAKGVDLHSPNVDDEYLVQADSALLRRVLINLLDNAIRHTPTGSRVMCDLFKHGGKITITIADEGQGFDPDVRSRMFQPYQGGKIAGAGLGLSFVGTVIQRHGGHVGLEPPAGLPANETGTCFYITLDEDRDEDEA